MAPGLGPGVPEPERRLRVEGTAALVPAAAPELEVEVAAVRVAGLAHRADALAGGDLVALAEGRGLGEVHVGVVDVRGRAVDDDVVAGGPVIAAVLHAPRTRGHQLLAALRKDVVTLVRPPATAGPVLCSGAAVVVATADREDVRVEIEGVPLGVRGRCAAGKRAIGP